MEHPLEALVALMSIHFCRSKQLKLTLSISALHERPTLKEVKEGGGDWRKEGFYAKNRLITRYNFINTQAKAIKLCNLKLNLIGAIRLWHVVS